MKFFSVAHKCISKFTAIIMSSLSLAWNLNAVFEHELFFPRKFHHLGNRAKQLVIMNSKKITISKLFERSQTSFVVQLDMGRGANFILRIEKDLFWKIYLIQIYLEVCYSLLFNLAISFWNHNYVISTYCKIGNFRTVTTRFFSSHWSVCLVPSTVLALS